MSNMRALGVGMALALATIGLGQDTERDDANLLVDVSGRLVSAAAAQTVDEVRPVCEYILETDIVGTGRTIAKSHAEMVPDVQRALVDLVLRGTTYSNAVGSKDSMRAYLTVCMPFEVRKRIVIDAAGIHGWPACASAQAMSRLLCMTNLQGYDDTLGVHFARRIFYQDQALAEHITARRAESRLACEMEDEVTAPLKAVGKVV